MDMLTDLMSMKARGSHCVPPHLPHVGDDSHLPSCQEEQACRRRVKGAPRAWLWGGPASSPQEPHLGTQSAALHWFKQPPKKDMSCTHSPGLFDNYDVYLLIILCYLFSFGLFISYNLIKISFLFFFCIINSQKLKSLISDAVGRKTQFTLQLTFSARLQ